jgi:hypothetical protein
MEQDRFRLLTEYLAGEPGRIGSHEFIDGRSVPVATDTACCNLIRGNTFVLLHQAGVAGSCRVFGRGLRVITPSGEALYPGIVGACMPVAPGARHVEDAVFVVEVADDAANSTSNQQRIEAYRTLPSIRHILILGQREHAVDVSTRRTSEWTRETVTGRRALVPMAAVGVTLAIADIYQDVDG